MAEIAKNLEEGEKGTCLEGSKKDDKGKKGKKK